jgi:methionyl-tRNA formyltransferase
VDLVLTQPDRPSGRGMQTAPSAVKRLALARGIDVFQPESLKPEDAVARVRGVGADAMVVAAYGLILPQAVLCATPRGALNIHASLLPRWRGAAPIQRAILAGDRETGISIMQMDRGLDTGPVLARRSIAVAEDEDTGTLHEKLAAAGAEMIVITLENLAALPQEPQPAEGATYARKIDKKETQLDWLHPAVELERAVRAFRPTPGATTHFEGVALKIWRARVVEGTGNPGTVLRAGDEIVIACGSESALAVSELQRSGGKRLQAKEFLRGNPLALGTRLGQVA